MTNDKIVVIDKLKGHSGCEVLLVEREKIKFVRKYSKNEYSNRLILQAEKQNNFISSFLKVPKIINITKSDSKSYIDMEYINGLHFNDYILQKDIKYVKNIAEKLFDELITRKEFDTIDTKEVEKKLYSLKKYSNSNIINKSLKYLSNFKWDSIKSSYCHGDLTFENILVKNNDIYLIDFLDSFIATKYIDIAKILQDIDIYWSLRNKTIDSNLLIRYQVIKKVLLDKLTTKEKEISYTFLLLNLLRILPYTTDEQTKQFLYKKIEFIYFIIEENIYE